MSLIRLYLFKRRCGLSPWRSFTRALQAMRRDYTLTKGPRL